MKIAGTMNSLWHIILSKCLGLEVDAVFSPFFQMFPEPGGMYTGYKSDSEDEDAYSDEETGNDDT
jgi:hypothetical protein